MRELEVAHEVRDGHTLTTTAAKVPRGRLNNSFAYAVFVLRRISHQEMLYIISFRRVKECPGWPVNEYRKEALLKLPA